MLGLDAIRASVAAHDDMAPTQHMVTDTDGPDKGFVPKKISHGPARPGHLIKARGVPDGPGIPRTSRERAMTVKGLRVGAKGRWHNLRQCLRTLVSTIFRVRMFNDLLIGRLVKWKM
jgi:hypothetical protein